ncbi:MAG: DUF6291 domain-containing protein [Thermotogota bacterium]
MNERKNSFLFYIDNYTDSMKNLTYEQKGKIFDAIIHAAGGIAKEPEDLGMLKLAIDPIVAAIRRSNEKYQKECEVNRINGKKGGRPKGQKTEGLNEKPSGFDKKLGDIYKPNVTLSGSELEPEPEPEPEPDSEIVPEPDSDQKNSAAINKIFQKYKTELKGLLPIPVKLTSKRRGSINARIQDYGFDKVYNEWIDQLKKSEYLHSSYSGEVTWLNFDWLINPNNFVKILEGKYIETKYDFLKGY